MSIPKAEILEMRILYEFAVLVGLRALYVVFFKI